MTSPVTINPNLTDIESQTTTNPVVKWNGREVSQLPTSHDNIGCCLSRFKILIIAFAVFGTVMAFPGWALYGLMKEGSDERRLGLGMAVIGTAFLGSDVCLIVASLIFWICVIKEKD